jgi:type II secretory pathway component PulK
MFLLSVLVVLMLVTTVATSLYLYFQALCQVLASDCKKVQKL